MKRAKPIIEPATSLHPHLRNVASTVWPTARRFGQKAGVRKSGLKRKRAFLRPTSFCSTQSTRSRLNLRCFELIGNDQQPR